MIPSNIQIRIKLDVSIRLQNIHFHKYLYAFPVQDKDFLSAKFTQQGMLFYFKVDNYKKVQLP